MAAGLGLLLAVCAAGAPPPAAEGGDCAAAPPVELHPDEVPAGCRLLKTVHLVRHAQGTHNRAESRVERDRAHERNETLARLHAEHGPAWVLLEATTGRKYHDPPLTTTGRVQAAALQMALRRAPIRLDAVYVSPMRRTLQTAMIGLPHLRDPHQKVSFVATDLIRERVANYTCDERSAASRLRQLFPRVTDWSEVEEEDAMFRDRKEAGPGEAAKVRARATEALRWLLGRPGREVALVSHQHFLKGFAELSPRLAGWPGFRNAERRVVHVCEAEPAV